MVLKLVAKIKDTPVNTLSKTTAFHDELMTTCRQSCYS
jgi:hypothetical protein